VINDVCESMAKISLIDKCKHWLWWIFFRSNFTTLWNLEKV